MKHTLCLSALLLSTTAAIAGGPVYVPPPVIPLVQPVEQWTGPYAGVQLGYGIAETGSPNSTSFDMNGMVYGVHAGYNYDLGTIIISGELDYNLANINGTFDGDAVVKTLAHAKARIGYDMGSAMLYGTGGMAYAESELFNGTSSYSGTGYFGGVGIEYMISNNWGVGAEYLYHQFNDFYFGDTDLKLQTIQARASYHF